MKKILMMLIMFMSVTFAGFAMNPKNLEFVLNTPAAINFVYTEDCDKFGINIEQKNKYCETVAETQQITVRKINDKYFIGPAIEMADFDKMKEADLKITVFVNPKYKKNTSIACSSNIYVNTLNTAIN